MRAIVLCFCFLFLFLKISFFPIFAQQKIKPFLGVSYKAFSLREVLSAEKNKNKYAIRILYILPQTAAEKAGLQQNDIVVMVDGQEFLKKTANENREFFKTKITEKEIGQKLELQIIRLKEQYQVADKILQNNKEWLEFIKQQEYNKNIDLQFQKKTVILDFSIELGSNPFREATTDIDPSFFDFYDAGKEQAPLLKQVFSKYDLQASADEVVDVFIEDQKTNYGCRMPAIRFLHRYPEKLLPTIDKTTSKIYQGSKQGMTTLLTQTAGLLGQSNLTTNIPSFPKNNNWQEHLAYIQTIFQISQELENQAFVSLSSAEKKTAREYFQSVQEELVQNFGLANNSKLSQKSYDIRLIAQKIDFLELLKSAWVLSHFSNPKWHFFLKKALLKLPKLDIEFKEAKGEFLWVEKKQNFSLVVGSRGDNRYENYFSMIIDLGGADYYTAKDTASKIILDLAGDDFYSSTKNYSQAAAFLGLKLLIDVAGNDNYIAQNFAQGSAVFGVGLLYDMQGNDFYKSNGFSQGYAFYGLGILLDNQGNDEYAANIFSQAVATCNGVGLLLDRKGNDKYRAGLQQASTYRTAGGFHGASQGLGFGIRGYFDGGIGVLLDGKGKDIFQAGNFSQGSGYFFGLGVLKNFGVDDDSYIAYRYGQSSAAHSALGVLIDNGGNDTYRGQVAAVQSAAWDKSATAFWDKKGNDNYITFQTSFSLAAAAHNGYAYFLDSAGKDNYQIANFNTTTQNSYHGGYSLSFFFDLGGNKDEYQQDDIQNNDSWKKRTTQIFWDK